MDLFHADETLQRLESEPEFNAGFAPALVQSFRRRIAQVRAARDPADLVALKSLQWRRASNEINGRYMIKLSADDQLLMQLEEPPATLRVTVLSIKKTRFEGGHS